jgi:hypothetical protein
VHATAAALRYIGLILEDVAGFAPKSLAERVQNTESGQALQDRLECQVRPGTDCTFAQLHHIYKVHTNLNLVLVIGSCTILPRPVGRGLVHLHSGHAVNCVRLHLNLVKFNRVPRFVEHCCQQKAIT